jgi:hypothetical protein
MAAQFTSTNGLLARGDETMDRARDKLFSCPVLPGDEDTGRRHGDLLDLIRERPDRVRLAHDLEARLDRLTQPRVFFPQ